MAGEGGDESGEWPEVKRINGYAVLLGNLTMATRGLGFLVVTWTMVVLLGGFVSILSKKDFWCLTLITFIQVAGIVDVFVGESMGSVEYSGSGLFALTKLFARNRMTNTRESRCILRVAAFVKQVVGWTAASIHILAYVIVINAICFIYFLGLFIATAVSLWRLIERDYGFVDGDPSKANFKTALDVLYILVVIQGSIDVYRSISPVYTWRRIQKEVALECGFDGDDAILLSRYASEIEKGCLKDPSFAKGKNLVTYAVDLMAPDRSHENHLSGLFILSSLIGPFSHRQPNKMEGQRTLIITLITYASFSTHILNYLLLLSNPRNCTDDTSAGERLHREVRERAVRLMAHVAVGISLEQLPRAIQCVSLLFDTFGEYQQRAFCEDTDLGSGGSGEQMEGYFSMLQKGLRIILVLTDDEEKCRVISETPGLLPKIMAPLTLDILHQTNLVDWKDVVTESLSLVRRLVDAPGDAGAKLRSEISINREAISTMKKIISSDKCDEDHCPLSIIILVKLYADSGITEDFARTLVGIFTDDVKDSSIRTLAIEALPILFSKGKSDDMIISQLNGHVVDHLKGELVASIRDSRYLKSAAQILEHLCIHYTKDDEFLKKLKEAMTDMMPKVLSQILTGDIEDQHASSLQENAPSKSSSTPLESEEVREDPETQAALLSLCVTVCETFVTGDEDLGLQFDATGEFSLPSKLRDMVVKNSDLTPSCLKLMKLTSRMIISMVKHIGTYYPKQELESLLVALPNASRRSMFLVDTSMVFGSGGKNSLAATKKKPERTLMSLVEEATELVRSYYNPEGTC